MMGLLRENTRKLNKGKEVGFDCLQYLGSSGAQLEDGRLGGLNSQAVAARPKTIFEIYPCRWMMDLS